MCIRDSTTTFLDAWSAGISSESLSKKLSGKWVAVVVTVIGTVAAILFPMDDITNFLYPVSYTHLQYNVPPLHVRPGHERPPLPA